MKKKSERTFETPCNEETPHLTLKWNNFMIVLTMTAKPTPFFYNEGTIYNGFFDRHFYQNSPPPTPSPGRREQKKSRCEWEFTTQYSQSSLSISETLNKGYQMIISKLNESVICFGSFLIIQELNKTLWLLYKMFKYQFFSIWPSKLEDRNL